MNCVNVIYPGGGTSAIVITSKNKPTESKNLIAFCKYLNINFQTSKLENFVEGDSFGSTGLLVDGAFLSYDFFREHNISVSNMIKRVVQVRAVARVCYGGGA